MACFGKNTTQTAQHRGIRYTAQLLNAPIRDTTDQPEGDILVRTGRSPDVTITFRIRDGSHMVWRGNMVHPFEYLREHVFIQMDSPWQKKR